MTSEDEGEYGRQVTVEADPMEQETMPTASHAHEDFRLLTSDQLAAIKPQQATTASIGAWLKSLPVACDSHEWNVVEIRMRPDRAWDVVKDLVVTACMGKSLTMQEEKENSVLLRRQLHQETMAAGVAQATTYENVFARIGVLPSKLRVLHMGYVVSCERNVLGAAVPSQAQRLAATNLETTKEAEYGLDRLVGSIQSTLLNQQLTLSQLDDASADSTDSVETAELDAGYIKDVGRKFTSEMKTNMRELSIPLEEYAYEEEFSCALLVGLLEPLLKKHEIQVNALSTPDASTPNLPDKLMPNATAEDAKDLEDKAAPPVHEQEKGAYAKRIQQLVQRLWDQAQTQCERKVREKVGEKQRQVQSRVSTVQKLRSRVIQAIVDCPDADVSSMKPQAQANKRDDVLLYEASCMINKTPVKLHVTYGAIVYRSMVPFFSTTTVVPFDDIQAVSPSMTLGLRTLYVQLKDNSGSTQSFTIAMGLEVDLVYQLLLEILSMHGIELERQALERSEEEAAEIERLVGGEEEESKQAEDVDAPAASRNVELPA